MKPNAASAVVIMERRSEWPAMQYSLANSIVISEEPDERIESLMARVERRLRVGGISAEKVVLAILACSTASGPAQQAQRSKVAGMLLDTVGAEGGRLLLCAPSFAPPALRMELLEIVGQLVVDKPSCGRASVAVRFGVRGQNKPQPSYVPALIPCSA